MEIELEDEREFEQDGPQYIEADSDDDDYEDDDMEELSMVCNKIIIYNNYFKIYSLYTYFIV